MVLNCGAIPENLIESELFGHVKGAFTGATAAKEGLFRAANGGTLFLDEVGELPPPLQVKLLRVLQDRKVRPVGGSAEVEVDVRVVAATNRDVESEVEAGTFREDLFYRLNVIRIEVPPLRERPEDIPVLAGYFLQKHAALQGRRLEFSPEAMRWLAQQSYAGNVRELENMVERGVTLAPGSTVNREDLGDTHPSKKAVESVPDPRGRVRAGRLPHPGGAGAALPRTRSGRGRPQEGRRAARHELPAVPVSFGKAHIARSGRCGQRLI